jgi:DNA-directed RNA polymerase II subunit RPB2
VGYGGGGGEEMDEDADGDAEQQEDITQDDAWAVISAYFEEKGLRQQLDSFDEFIQNTMQEIVDESADIEIRPELQHNPGRQAEFAEVVAPL